jgi:hypothetical protein
MNTEMETSMGSHRKHIALETSKSQNGNDDFYVKTYQQYVFLNIEVISK